MQIFTVYVYGDCYRFLDNLSEEEKNKCGEVAARYRADAEKHSLEDYLVELRERHGITFQMVPVTFCVGF